MKHICRTFMLGASLMALSGCGTIDHEPRLGNAIAQDVVSLNEAYGSANNAVILTNILRARDRWPTTYTTLSGIQSTPQLNRESDINLTPLGLGNPMGPLQGTASKFVSKSKEGGSYNVNPFASDDNTKSPAILTAVNSKLFKEYFDRWPKDVSVLLFVNGLKQYDYNGKAQYRKPTNTTNVIERLEYNDGENIEGFIEELAKSLGVQTRDPYNKNIKTRDLIHFNISDHVDLVKLNKSSPMACQEIIRPVGKSRKEFIEFASLLDATKKVTVNIIPTPSDVKLKVCKKSSDTFVFKLRNNHKNPLQTGDFTAETFFELRSLDSMVYYIGETLRRPQYVVRTHCARRGYKANGEYSHNIKEMGPLFSIYPSSLAESVNYGAQTFHAGRQYYALPNEQNLLSQGSCLKERTSTVMSILNQILLLSQSKDALKTPENIFNR